MTDFLIKALLGGIGMSVIAGALGVFIIWRRLSFFGDTVAHASLGGVAISLLLGISSFWGPFLSGFGIAVVMSMLKKRMQLANDTWLAIISQIALALGILSLSFFRSQGVQLQEFLFGDILALSTENILILYASAVLIVSVILVLWRKLLLMTISQDLAHVQHMNVVLYENIFLGVLALGVALCIKFFGILLLTALMIIPASTARQLASSPLKMLGMSIVVGIISVSLGLFFSYLYDVPTSPMIVVCSALMLMASLMFRLIQTRSIKS